MYLVRFVGIVLIVLLVISASPIYAQEDNVICDNVTTALWFMAELKGYSQFQSTNDIVKVDTSQYDPGHFAPLFDLLPPYVEHELRVNEASLAALNSVFQGLASGAEDVPLNPMMDVVDENPACKNLRASAVSFLMADALIEALGDSLQSTQVDAPTELPDAAQQALDARIQADFGTMDYTISRVEAVGDSQLCVVIDPPLAGQLTGQTLYYDYAVLQNDGTGWSAIMVEDHIDGVVLSIFGCDMVYKDQ